MSSRCATCKEFAHIYLKELYDDSLTNPQLQGKLSILSVSVQDSMDSLKLCAFASFGAFFISLDY
jgi:hypothetical protein